MAACSRARDCTQLSGSHGTGGTSNPSTYPEASSSLAAAAAAEAAHVAVATAGIYQIAVGGGLEVSLVNAEPDMRRGDPMRWRMLRHARNK